MRTLGFTRRILPLVLLAGLASPSQAQETRPLVVFAAASLQTALTAIATDWQRETGKRVTFSFAASSALARQLDQGAPADLFASADLDWMDFAEQRRLIRAGTRRTLLGNSLVLIEPVSETPVALTIAPGFPLAAAIGSSRLAPAMSSPSLSAAMRRLRSPPSASGRRSPRASPAPTMSARRWPSWRAARRASASSMRPMPGRSRGCASSARFPPAATRPSPIRSP